MKIASRWFLSLSCVAALGLPACVSETSTDSAENDATEISAQPKNGGEVEVFRSESSKQFHFRLQAPNGETLLQSEGYQGLGGVRNGTESLKRNGQLSSAFEIKKGKSGKWYFNVKAGNGQILGTSETYSSKSKATKGAKDVMAYLKGQTKVDYWTDQCGFELYTGNDDAMWFRVRAANGKGVLKSESYTTEATAKTAIDTVVTTSLIAEDESGGLPAYVVFKGAGNKYFWHLKAANGEIVATGGQGFSTKAKAKASVELVKELANEQAGCWTADEPSELDPGQPADLGDDLSGVVDDTFIGEMDPFVVGDVCVLFVEPYDGSGLVGLLEDESSCEYTTQYSELNGFAVFVAEGDMRAVSASEDAVLQDYAEARYYWLEGPVESTE